VTARVRKRTYLSDRAKQPGDVDMSVTYTGTNTRTQVYLVNLTVFCSELTYNKNDRLVLAGTTDATNAFLYRITGLSVILR